MSLYSDAINLTEKEIDSIYEKWKKDLKKEVEELQAKNDLAYALGFVYFWLVAADGDISDEEINTLNEYKKFICIHPRFPLSIFLDFGKSKYKKGLVVFDYILCMKLSTFFQKLFFSNAKYKLIKK